MSPAQVVRLNFWLPILAGIAGMALTAGMAFGFMGADVAQNTEDIADLRSKEETVTDIRIAQGTAATERQGLKEGLSEAKDERRDLKEGLDDIRQILERRWPTSGT